VRQPPPCLSARSATDLTTELSVRVFGLARQCLPIAATMRQTKRQKPSPDLAATRQVFVRFAIVVAV